ncbi:hypothetical protein [Pimelobacter simplex]|uniref:hypothetical protein n=1 Tax=Nocardioides simplex TaxID=2045 RepID=UPI003AAAA84E
MGRVRHFLAWGACSSALLIALAGCGGDDKDAAADAPSSTPPTSAMPTEEARPLVSPLTTCQLIFDDADPDGGPLGQMLKIVTAEDIDGATLTEIKTALETVEEASKTAQPELAAQLKVLLDATKDGVQQFENSGGAMSLDTAPIQAATLEVTNVCRDA